MGRIVLVFIQSPIRSGFQFPISAEIRWSIFFLKTFHLHCISCAGMGGVFSHWLFMDHTNIWIFPTLFSSSILLWNANKDGSTAKTNWIGENQKKRWGEEGRQIQGKEQRSSSEEIQQLGWVEEEPTYEIMISNYKQSNRDSFIPGIT